MLTAQQSVHTNYLLERVAALKHGNNVRVALGSS